MTWLNDEAFDAYVALGICPPARLPLGPHVILKRLDALRDLVEPRGRHAELVNLMFRDWWYDKRSWLSAEERWLWEERPWRGVTDWEDTSGEVEVEVAWRSGGSKDEGENQAVAEDASGRDESTTSGSASEASDALGTLRQERSRAQEALRSSPPVLQFIIGRGGQTGLSRVWDVHQGDADPYPSIPHGHEFKGRFSRAYPKLDVFTGEIHSKDKVTARENRRAITLLWRDSAFREFAHKALVHTLENDPTFRSRLVSERGITDPLHLPRRR